LVDLKKDIANPMITIIDYGVGNVNSIQNMLRKLGAESEVTNDPEKIRDSKKIILPGVGAYDTAMHRLNELGLVDEIIGRVKGGVPLLGICLGAQLLLNGSEEGKLPGLGVIRGMCKKFKQEDVAPLRVPHMGWSEVALRYDHPLTRFDLPFPRFYFVHSYYMQCEQPEQVLATARYGVSFASAIHRDNIYGVQFHPEKSHKFGERLLSNFWKL
jgi:imidazole glycerol-phosphate synthase subunit HisH